MFYLDENSKSTSRRWVPIMSAYNFYKLSETLPPCGYFMRVQALLSVFFSRVRTPLCPSNPRPPWWCQFLCLSRPGAYLRVDRRDAVASLRPPGALCSTAAWCTRKKRRRLLLLLLVEVVVMVKQLSAVMERLMVAEVTTPLHPCCVPSGWGQGCTAPSTPGGSREYKLCSFTTHTVSQYVIKPVISLAGDT